jgi:hypothetical protein
MRRQPGEIEVFDLANGDYMLTEDRTGVWLRTPAGDLLRVPVQEGERDPRPIAEGGNWGFTEHEDGSLSLQPSIQVLPSGWHGFLTNGVLTPV